MHVGCVQKPDNSADVAVGELIALIVEHGEDWKNVSIPATLTPSATPAPPADRDVTATPTPVT